MTVLLLGANGQLGSDILRAQKAKFPGVGIQPLYRKDLDISEVDSISKALSGREFDVLINCTSYHKTDEVESNASRAMVINAHAPRHLANLCKSKGALFIHISTDYVFDGRASRPYAEMDGPAPVNVYGASKLLGESLVQREYEDGSLIARVASLFGVAGASGKGGNFVETMLRLAREKGEVRVISDIRMSPTCTADAAHVILSLIEMNAAPGVYHVVNSGEASWFEFAREIIQRAGIPAKTVPIPSSEFPSPAARPMYSVLDNSKAAAVAGPIPNWKDALDHYLRDKGHVPR